MSGRADSIKLDERTTETGERVSPMHKKEKIAIAILAVLLALVIGLIIITGNRRAEEGAQTMQPDEPADIQTIQEADENAPTAQSEEDGEGVQLETEEETPVYEGAIAGLTEEEIAALALAEESAHAGEEAVDAEEPTGSVD